LHGGWPTPYGRWQFAFFYGNRERFFCGGGGVEMYVSFLISFFHFYEMCPGERDGFQPIVIGT